MWLQQLKRRQNQKTLLAYRILGVHVYTHSSWFLSLQVVLLFSGHTGNSETAAAGLSLITLLADCAGELFSFLLFIADKYFFSVLAIKLLVVFL